MRVQATFVVCLLASTSLSTVVFAQPAEPEAAPTDKVEKVVVTAQRRPQQAQGIGIALTPVKGDTLRKQGINTINGLENITPSLEVENQFGSGQPSFTIRGLGFRDYATNNTPTVGIYVDEVAYPIPVMTQGVLYDVQRVEVLRGPQGTLYGRNTTGGAVNIISNKPSPEFGGGFQVEYGRFDEARAEGYLNAPITDGISTRLSIATQQGGAWQVNRETGEKHRHFEFFWFPYADSVLAKSLDETTEEVGAPLTAEQMAARGERVSADQRTFKYGCEVVRLVPALSPRLQRLFTRASMVTSTRARWSHEIFPSPRNVKFNEMEYAIPAANGADCIREIAEVIRNRKIAGVFPIEFRFVKADDSWLSPFYKRDAVTISVHQYHRQSYTALFEAAEAVFRRYGGRPHWGKLHTLKAADFERLYPRWGDFQTLRRRLDPTDKLLNAHLKTVFGV